MSYSITEVQISTDPDAQVPDEVPPWFEHSVLVKQVPFRGEAFLKHFQF